MYNKQSVWDQVLILVGWKEEDIDAQDFTRIRNVYT